MLIMELLCCYSLGGSSAEALIFLVVSLIVGFSFWTCGARQVETERREARGPDTMETNGREGGRTSGVLL